jgi:DNA-binding NtrC family response regulator
VDSAVQALRQGASDYLEKPFPIEDLCRRVRRLVRYRVALQETQRRQSTVHAPGGQGALIGESPALRTVRGQIARCAPTPSNVLITGESGTGKELTARAIHAGSPRRDRPFVPVNCGAIPEALIESQLFGHVRGAFTSAVQSNPGLFAAAHGGTLFLDEITELPVALQVKLLRVIEERQVWAVGGTRAQPVDVRIIASTNRDLGDDLELARLRPDLFYRLKVVTIALPPLRDRRGDIPLLVDHFIRRLNLKLGRRVLGIDRDALRLLESQPWRGNVRELENVLECAMVLGDGDVIGLRHLPDGLVRTAPVPNTDLRAAVRLFEHRHVLEALVTAQFDKRVAARTLGISLASLYRKLAPDPSGSPDIG